MSKKDMPVFGRYLKRRRPWSPPRPVLYLLVLSLFLGAAVLAAGGCIRHLQMNGPKEKVEYDICKDSNLPAQLQTLLEEKKQEVCTFVYRNSMYIYLVVCYGRKEYSGCSVKIEECWKSEDTLFLRTQLMGPAAGEEVARTPTCPYLVVRCRQMDVFCVIEA